MKKTLVLIGFAAALLTMVFSSYGSDESDAPHNASRSIYCTDCHPAQNQQPYSDDLCLSCHLNATGGGYIKNSAPRMLTHSSENTTDKYGTWSKTCIACHNQHIQDQVTTYGPDAYLVTGTISSVTDNGDGTSTFGYMNLVENQTGWADFTKWAKKSDRNASAGNERGLILFPNTANSAVSFEILSATSTDMTVKGSINTAFPNTVSTGATFALVYGQLIKSQVLTDASGTMSVRFFQNSSLKSFAYNDVATPGAPDPTPDGICQVCHTRTSFWRYDGAVAEHFSGTNCTRCHKHEAGFKTSCDVCHDSPPSTGAHSAHFESAEPRYGTTKIQSTTTTYGFSCGICHQGTHLNTASDPRNVEVAFSGVAVQDGASGAAYSASTYSVDDPGKGYSFNYSDGTCSNTYCHGNYPGSGRNSSVTFNTGSALCGSCHGASNADPPASGSHTKHASNAGRNYSCVLCHQETVSASGPDYLIADKSKHVNGAVDWKFDLTDAKVSLSSSYSISSGISAPSDGISRLYGTCSNIYCHGATLETAGTNTIPQWNDPATAVCGSCHGISSTSNFPTRGSHTKHAGPLSGSIGYEIGCQTCHKTTTTTGTTITDPGKHVNNAADWGFDTSDSRVSSARYRSYSSGAVSNPPSTSYGTCSTVYCHSNAQSSPPGSAITYASPVWGVASTGQCGTCHKADGVQGDASAMDSGTHSRHVSGTSAGYNGGFVKYPCSACHYGVGEGTVSHADGKIDVVLQSSYGGSYSGTTTPGDAYGSCSNVRCHSNIQPDGGVGGPTAYGNPTWNVSTRCAGCHRTTTDLHAGIAAGDSSRIQINSGSHSAHLSYTFNVYNYSIIRKCVICHKWNDSAPYPSVSGCNIYCHNAPALYHGNGIVDVRIDTLIGGDYVGGSTAPGSAYSSCENTYCHSNGTSVATGITPTNTSPVWGQGGLSCNSCHGNPPSYSNGSPKKNSHAPHAAESCNKCHVTTTADGTTIASKTTHVDQAYTLSPDTSSGVTFTYTFSTDGGSCTNISCHNYGSAQWGTSVPCQDCHVGAADVDDFSGTFYNNGSASKIQGAGEWDTTGHGRPAASGNYFSGNAAADFTVSNACLFCHDSAVTHKLSSNPFRLRNLDDTSWGKNGVCQNCHADGSAGITVDTVFRNGAKKVGSTHYGAKHTSSAGGGQFCWDCHDPHGDGNIFMVQAAVAKTSDSTTGAPVSTVTTSFVSYSTGTYYAVSEQPYTGVCNVCHDSTNHYTGTSGDGHNQSTRCTNCHSHTGSTTTDAFKASCDACHGNPPVDDTTLVGFVVPSRTGSTTAGAHQTHVSTLQISCDSCHVKSTGTGTMHNNGDLDVTIGFSLFSGNYTGGMYNGQTTVTYNVSEPSTTVSSSGLKECSNIYCHGSTMAPNNGTDITPVWDKPSTASCGTCHGATAATPPTRGAHYRHAGPYTDVGHEYPCSWCHKDPAVDASLHVNNKSEVVFSTHPTVSGGTYSGTSAMLDAYGSCTNVYCHSNVQTSPPGGPLTYKTINWATSYGGDMACNLCHEGPSDHYEEPLNGNTSGSHPKHAAYRFYCATCHANDITQDPDPATVGWACFACHTWNGPYVTHANNSVDVNIVTKYGGSYTGTPAPGDAYGKCSTTYCHSTGTSVRTGTVASALTPTWGSGSLACNACHGNTSYPAPNNGMPDYSNGNPKENSHAAHVISSSIPCQNCHAGTTSDGLTIANTALHVNKQYDTKAAGSFNGKAISFTYTVPTISTAGRCSSISCHGGGSASWGESLKCSSCHAGASDVNNFTYGDGTVAMISSSQWSSSGHGRATASGNYPQSGKPAANFDGTAGADDACQYCHDKSVAHNASSNPFRLRWTDGADGQNGNCLKCHKPGSTGYISGVDGALPNKDASAATKVEDYHWLQAPGGKHTDTRNGGKFCWDCHDPHGDMNVSMIHDAVSKRNDWNGTTGYGIPTLTSATSFTTMNTWASYVNASGSGICQACHENTAHFTGSTNYDTNHNPNLACTSCHTHLGSSTTTGDAFPGAESGGGTACGSCHTDLYTNMNSIAGTTYHHLIPSDAASYRNGTCLQCHADHNIFRPDINTANTTGRSANLRTNIGTAPAAPPTTAGYTNTDFTTTDADGGICLSCHKTEQTKGYPQPDGSSATPVVPYSGGSKAGYQASAHRYTVQSTFRKDNSTFNADCSKCHNDTLNPKSSFNAQSSSNTFGNHSSLLGKILAALGITSSDPREEKFCYQCHSRTTDSISGVTPKQIAGQDYYMTSAMSAPAEAMYDLGRFSLTNTLYFRETAPKSPAPVGSWSSDSFRGGTWQAREMLPLRGSNYQVQTVTLNDTGNPRYWRMTSFVSPPVSSQTVVPAGNWTLTMWGSENTAASNCYLRGTIYVWTAGNTLGQVIASPISLPNDIYEWIPPGCDEYGCWDGHWELVTLNQFSQSYSARTLTIPGSSVTLNAGDRIVMEVEADSRATSATSNSCTFAWNGSSAENSSIVIPSAVSFNWLSSNASAHHVDSYSNLHKASATEETRAYLSANKHIECDDCHNPHAASAGTHTPGTNAVSNAIKGADGVQVPSWSQSWTAPNFTDERTTATYEWQVCFKCHSSYNTNLSGWNTGWTDLAKEFNPNNPSYHAVIGASKLPAQGSFVNGWSRTSTVTCSDCHTNSSTGTGDPKGPHASSNAALLKGDGKSGELCFNCHNSTFSNSGFSGPDGELHNCHFNFCNDGTPLNCYTCHSKIPHGAPRPRLFVLNGDDPKYLDPSTGHENSWTQNTGGYTGSECSGYCH